MRALPYLALALVACGNAESRPSVVTLPAQPAPPPKVAAKPEPPPPPKPAEVFDAPEAPAVRPIAPKLPVDGVALLLGANASDMWVYVNAYSAVVSRATGCATEAYVDSPLLKQLVTSETGDDPGEELAKDDVKRAIRELVVAELASTLDLLRQLGLQLTLECGDLVVESLENTLFHRLNG